MLKCYLINIIYVQVSIDLLAKMLKIYLKHFQFKMAGIAFKDLCEFVSIMVPHVLKDLDFASRRSGMSGFLSFTANLPLCCPYGRVR